MYITCLAINENQSNNWDWVAGGTREMRSSQTTLFIIQCTSDMYFLILRHIIHIIEGSRWGYPNPVLIF